MVPFVLQAFIVVPGNLQTHKQIGLEKFLDRSVGVGTETAPSSMYGGCAATMSQSQRD